MHIIDSTDVEVAWFEGNRAGDTGAYIAIRHNPSSAAETNRAGIKFQADDDGGNVTNYAQVKMYIEDNTNTTEDGRLAINVMSDGSDNEVVNIRKDQFIYTGDAGSSFIRVDNRADGHDTGFEIYQNGSRKWELHSDDSSTDALSFRNNAGTEKFKFAQDGSFTAGATTLSGNLTMMSNVVYASQVYVADRLGHLNDASTFIDFDTDTIKFATSGESMRITSDNRVYIGTTSPSTNGILSVEAGNAGLPMIYCKNTNADSVGIRAEVNSNASSNFIYEAMNTDGQVWKIRNDGDHFGTDTSIGSLSDSRLKKDVSDLTYDINKFKQYRPVEFNWINPELHKSASGKSRGFLAQEVKALDDYYVDKYEAQGDDVPLVDSDGKAHSTKFGYKDAMYISVIKQLITRIEALESA